MSNEKQKVGLLPLYLKLYDDGKASACQSIGGFEGRGIGQVQCHDSLGPGLFERSYRCLEFGMCTADRSGHDLEFPFFQL
ncbi:hypothetical protein ES708_05780 [subsurface metagenome]